MADDNEENKTPPPPKEPKNPPRPADRELSAAQKKAYFGAKDYSK